MDDLFASLEAGFERVIQAASHRPYARPPLDPDVKRDLEQRTIDYLRAHAAALEAQAEQVRDEADRAQERFDERWST
jgi:hypothetical protein